MREYLSLTISMDHDVIDGAPAARFAARLSELVESGAVLEERPMRDQGLQSTQRKEANRWGENRPYIRPGFFMTRIFNPINRRLGLFPTLTVRGRRSGELRTIPLGRPIEYAGACYLVSGRGHTDWARNLRAAGRGELRIGRVTETFRAVEVEGDERERVVAAYRANLGRAVKGYFERIPDAADHPVFRIERLAARATPAA